MLKREKEVFGYLLDTEEAVMKELEKQYRQALDDINTSIRLMQADEWSQSRAYHIQYQKTLKKQVEAILEKLHSDEYTTMQRYLSGTYTDAYVGTVYALHGQSVPVIMPIDQKAALKAVMTDSKINTDLYTHLGVDITRLKKTIRNEITRGIASGMLFQDIARNVAFNSNISLNRAKNIAQTEGHRIQQASADDARHHAISRGADIVKQWDATLDMNTRDTHRALDGQIREVDEPFEMHGKEAQYPGGFGDPSEDCRCRCVALTRARSALDAAELATMKERAKFFGLDKTKDFEDFKGKYLKAAEDPANTTKPLNNQGKSGIIQVRNSALPNGLPMKGEPDSIVDKTDDDGNTLQRRLYNSQGLAQVDYDTSDHNRPDVHPTGAHKHVYDHSGKKPKRGKPEKLSEEELEHNSDIIRRGDNYHDEE